MTRRTRFVSDTVAADWQHGLVAGTGGVGAVLFGDAARHRIQLCHEEFFLPIHPALPAPLLAPVLPAVRAAVADGRFDDAAAIVEGAAAADGYPDGLLWTDPFVPLAELSWSPQDPTGTDYRRTGDFVSGRVETSWTDAAGTRLSLALVPDREAGTLHLELASDGPTSGVLSLSSEAVAEADGAHTVSSDYSAFLRTSPVRMHDRGLGLDLAVDVPDDGLPRSTWAPQGATVSIELDDAAAVPTSDGLRVTLRPGVPLRIAILLEPHGGRPTPSPAPVAHAELFARSDLDLHSGIDEGVPFERVLARARAGDAAATRAALELAFAAGRHTIISSTGALPPTLVGIWQGSRRPAWSGDYTQNGNVQHGAAAALVSAGTPELLLSYFRALGRHHGDYASNAERLFGAPGWLLPARFDSHGHANHFGTDFPHIFWVGAGGWAVRLAWDYFLATGDQEFLRDAAWPLARESMAFYDAVTAADDGMRRLSPSFSPENTPAGGANPLAVDATVDVAIIRDTARIAARIAALVGEQEVSAPWAAVAAGLPPYRVAPDGTFAEWLAPDTAEEMAHRHVSQLYPFWYEDDPAASDPALREAAVETIRRKLAWRAERPWGPPDGRMEMAFGLVGLGIAAARLGEAELARECATWLARDHWRPNGVSTHDADAIFNVDASGGLPAVVIEMLVQSQPGSVTLLPALPAAWEEGSLCGIRTRGGLVVEELRWTTDAVSARIRAVPGTSATRDGDRVLVRGPGGLETTIDVAEGATDVAFARARTEGER